MEHTKQLLSIKVSNLVPSPRNVLRHSTGDVQALAALIASQWLLHPLIVFERASAWWEPTAEGFLNHVSKGQIVLALREAGLDRAADGVETMKKDGLVTTAVARLKGTRWLPAPLRPVPR
jgi:hypothetical protein